MLRIFVVQHGQKQFVASCRPDELEGWKRKIMAVPGSEGWTLHVEGLEEVTAELPAVEKTLREQALEHARGPYQRDVVLGLEPISGKSKARFGKGLNEARRGLLERIRAAGIPFEIQLLDKRYVLVFGDEPRQGRKVEPHGSWYPPEL